MYIFIPSTTFVHYYRLRGHQYILTENTCCIIGGNISSQMNVLLKNQTGLKGQAECIAFI